MNKHNLQLFSLYPTWDELLLPPDLRVRQPYVIPLPIGPAHNEGGTISNVGSSQPPILTANGTGSVAENALGALTGISLVVTDSDTISFFASSFVITAPSSQENGQTLANKFEVQNLNGVWTLKLKAGESLDYEALTNKTITLSLTVSDGVNVSAAVEVQIAVTDVAGAPVITNGNLDVALYREASVGDVLATLMAMDDEGDTLTWRITAGNTGQFFAIDQQGRLTLRASLADDTSERYTLTIEVSDGNGGVATTNVVFRVADSIVIDSIFENHPVNKAITTISVPDNMVGADIRLADGALDNALFRLDADGKLWWLAKPDFENPGDSNDDNIYQLEVIFTLNGVETRRHYDLEVRDIGPGRYGYDKTNKPDGGVEDFVFARSFIPTPEIPDGLAEFLISNRGFVMPTTGPLILTWSLNPLSILAASILRPMINVAFDAFKAVANIKFIEVDYHNDLALSGDILVSFFNTMTPDEQGGRVLGRAHYGDENWRIEFFMGLTELNNNFDVLLHEIGHILGLKHPFHPVCFSCPEGQKGEWPYDEAHRKNPASIMSYYNSKPEEAFLKAADVAALRFLYGAPDEDHGVSAERFMLFRAIQDAGEQQTLRAISVSEGVEANALLYIFSPSTTLVQDAKTALPELNNGQNILTSRYDLADERDAEYFTLDPTTGRLRLKQKLDFDQPLDEYGGGVYAGNNIYEIKVKVTFTYRPANEIGITGNPHFIITGGEYDPVTGQYEIATYIGSAYLAVEIIENINLETGDIDIDLVVRGNGKTPHTDYRGKRVTGNDKDNEIRDGHGNDLLRGNAGDDDIWLTAAPNDNNRVVYRIGDHSAEDGADTIMGFVRGQDRLVLSLPDNADTRAITSFTSLINFINGGKVNDLTDDQFLVLLDINFDSNNDAMLTGLSFHFQNGALNDEGKVSMPMVSLTFADPITSTGLLTVLNVDQTMIPTIINSDGVLIDLNYFDDLMGGVASIGIIVEAL